MIRNELTEAEKEAVKKITSPEFMNDYKEVSSYYQEIDPRTDQEKALNHVVMKRKKSPAMQIFEEFEADMQKEIDRLANDPTILDSQKREIIAQIATQKKDEYKAKINEKYADYREKVAKVKDYLLESANATENMTPQQMRKMDFISREMESEIKTSLYTAFEPSQVLAIFNRQKDMAEHNQIKARWMHKNGHLFMSRIEQVAKDNNERARGITEIQKGINRIEQHAYDPHVLGIKKMLENTNTFRRTGIEGIRAIESNAKKYF